MQTPAGAESVGRAREEKVTNLVQFKQLDKHYCNIVVKVEVRFIKDLAMFIRIFFCLFLKDLEVGCVSECLLQREKKGRQYKILHSCH